MFNVILMVLKILQWNLNGYLNNYNELKLLLHNNSPHIIALQETHLKTNPSNSYIPKNTSLYAKHSLSPNHGVAFIISKNIAFNEIILSTQLDAIAIEITAKISFILINVYIPPTKSFSNQDLYSLIPNSNKPIIIVGDFNGWSPYWGSSSYNKRGKLITEFILNNNYVVLNKNSPTHFSTHKTFTNIDIAFCSPDLVTFSSWDILDCLHGSDHYPIEITLFPNENNHFTKRTVFKTDKADWTKFQQLGSEYIKIDENSNNTNCLAARIHKGIIKCANESMPKNTGNFSKKPICWWNVHLNSLNLDRKEKWKDFKKSSSITNLICYKRANALFKRESKVAKRKSFIEYTKDINPNTPVKILWDKVRALRGNPQPNIIKYLKTTDNITLDDPSDIANALAKNWFEYSKDTNFSEEYKQQKITVLRVNEVYYHISNRAKSIEKDISLIELQACINTVKGKTPGYDNISYPMLKNLLNTDKLKLCLLYNKIFQTSHIPFQWKKAIIVPIKKPNKPQDSLSGYRPISLLSCVSKILEKIIARRLYWFLYQENKVSHCQTAYKSESGTINALLALDEYITNSISTKNHVSVISIDAEKAFDRIGIHTIIQQLQKWKIGPLILNFIKSFLTNRRITVRVNNVFSNTYNLDNGIPQGSPLSVVLFLIAFNHLSVLIDESKYFKHIIYADDLYIYRIVQNVDLFKSKLNNLYSKIIEWCTYSGVKISEDKSKHLHICKKHSCNINISLNASRLDKVNDLRILGLTFNSRYLWNSHVNNLCISIQNRVNVLKCLSNLNLQPNSASLINIAKSTILSKIDYGLVIYGNTSKKNIGKLSSIYHAAIRLSLGAFCSTPIKNMLAESGLYSIPHRMEYLIGRLTPKILSPRPSLLNILVKKKIQRKRLPKKPSALTNILKYAQECNITLNYSYLKKLKHPPWNLKSTSIILSMAKWKKSDTPNAIYLKEYSEIREKYANWKFYFTDGSKSESGTGFSVIEENESTPLTYLALLPPTSSIFTAESQAILEACYQAMKSRGNKIICSDSFSTLASIRNINCTNYTICQIRDILIDKPNIKLVWIPSHIGIKGNEDADSEAKATTYRPLIFQNVFNPRDIKAAAYKNLKQKIQLEWQSYNHFYKSINPTQTKSSFPIDAARREMVTFTRMRLGHTRLTNKKYFDTNAPTNCIFCQSDEMSTQHLVDDCPVIYRISQNFGIDSIRHILQETSIVNVTLLTKLLKCCKIFYEI